MAPTAMCKIRTARSTAQPILRQSVPPSNSSSQAWEPPPLPRWPGTSPNPQLSRPMPSSTQAGGLFRSKARTLPRPSSPSPDSSRPCFKSPFRSPRPKPAAASPMLVWREASWGCTSSFSRYPPTCRMEILRSLLSRMESQCRKYCTWPYRTRLCVGRILLRLDQQIETHAVEVRKHKCDCAEGQQRTAVVGHYRRRSLNAGAVR